MSDVSGTNDVNDVNGKPTEINTREAAPVLYCANHPGRETVLRCNRCDKPICTDCAVLTPVGYRCRECVRGQQKAYFTGTPADPLIAAAVALVLGGIIGAAAYALLGIFGFFAFFAALFAGPVAGGLIAEGVRQSVGRRRSRRLNVVAALAAVIGMVVGGVFLLFLPMLLGGVPLAAWLAALPRMLFRLDVLLLAILAASTIYARLQ
jgi:MFS family permease